MQRNWHLSALDPHDNACCPIVQRQHCVTGNEEQRTISHVTREMDEAVKSTRGIDETVRTETIYIEQLPMPFQFTSRSANPLEPFIRARADDARDLQQFSLRRARHCVGCESRNAPQRLPREIAARRQRICGEDFPDEELKHGGCGSSP